MTDFVKKAIFGYADLGKVEDEIGAKAIDQYEELKATAYRCKELLREGLKPLNSAQYEVWVTKVEKELADDLATR